MTKKKEKVANWIHWSADKFSYIVFIWDDGTWTKIDLPFVGSFDLKIGDKRVSISKFMGFNHYVSKKIKTTEEGILNHIEYKIDEWKNMNYGLGNGGHCHYDYVKETSEKHYKEWKERYSKD